MKLSVSNLLFLVFAVAVTIACWIHSVSVSSELSKAKAKMREGDEARVAACRVYSEARMTMFYRPHREEHKLYDILDKYNVGILGCERSVAALRVLAMCKHYNEIEGKELVDSYLWMEMRVNEWSSLKDVMNAASLAQQPVEHDESAEYERILNNAQLPVWGRAPSAR